ncbi:hypothetical protein BDV93DRAFT_521073 [Ceratobasidium sp. AG-I]|nr:hypothetical protein BDV93DRAFT_521073 [Ceratobasidium sp. AG-I]
MTYKHIPGPLGASCLTCKRRHKKCDRGRPACKRCTIGDFECLGYDRNDQTAPGSSSVDSPRDSVWQGATTRENCDMPFQSPTLQFPGDAHPSTENSWMMFPSMTPLSLEPVTYATYASSILTAPLAPHLDDHIVLTPNAGNSNLTKHHAPSYIGSQQLLPAWRNPSLNQTYPTARPFASTPRRSGQYALPIPRSVPLEPTNIVHIINYVLTQYERLLALSYFRPSSQERVRFRYLVSCRLQLPGAARWAMYMGAQIFESLLNGVLLEKTATYGRLVQKFEQELHVIPNRDLTSDEIQDRLASELEVGFLKLRLGHDFHMVQLLRRCAPIFLQIVFSDPTLWPEGNTFAAVSVAHIFASTRHELSHFIHLDAFYAMAYAIPPTLEYDTSCPPFRTENNALEWMPPDIHITLIDINARGALDHVAPDWQDIERRILSWKPYRDESADDASQHIARLTEQESWRQTLLVYLYLAVCRVASDDPRVASAVRQIFQLLGTIGRQDSVMANSHFLVQYLIAGACTPSEKRRALVRSQLSDRHGNGLWHHPGSEFVPLLDHLWHGVAAHGRPIRWSDYMVSRQAVLPIPI